MIGFNQIWPQPKPEPKAKAKRRSKRHEAKLIRDVRKIVAERDGYCRFAHPLVCRGESQWAHWGDWRRFKTRGMPPEARHTTHGSLMLCQFHHDAYDGRHARYTLTIEAMTDGGCNGDLVPNLVERHGAA